MYAFIWHHTSCHLHEHPLLTKPEGQPHVSCDLLKVLLPVLLHQRLLRLEAHHGPVEPALITLIAFLIPALHESWQSS